jgi:hypothetical protein
MASVQETLEQINSVLKESTDGPYSNYSCKTVSWDDVQRGTVGGGLSCWGSNITDTRLYAKDGRQLFTVRGDNWNERLGKVTANDLALIASDEDGGGGSKELRPVTLRSVLSNISKYGKYANLGIDSLLDEKLDDAVSVRFQTTFLPVGEGEKQALEFAPEAYNYNTMDDEDPRNLVLLCTTQGLAIQQDGRGAKKLFHHAKDDGTIKRFWLEAESSSHKVGGSQVEGAEEREDALKRGKATSAVIGTKAIGTRFNVLMTIQVPLRQKEKKQIMFGSAKFAPTGSSSPGLAGESEMFYSAGCIVSDCLSEETGVDSAPKFRRLMKKSGKSTAARVSKGSEYDSWDGLTVKEPKRHPDEHVTATIVMYYTCSGGVPSAADVKSAIDDLEELYQALEVNGKLGDAEFDFMKSELTVKDMIDITTKIQTQPPPPAPKPSLPIDASVFPS